MATFDERAKDWDTPERIARAAEAADAIRANVALTPTDRVVDIGAGTGLLGLALLDDIGELVLAEPSDGMLAVIAEKLAAAELPQVTAVKLDLVADPPPDNPFDVAVSFLVLHHIKDTGTLQYDIYLNDDESEGIVLERYKNSEALIEHGANQGDLAAAIFATGTFVGEVLGKPSAKLKASLADAPVRIFKHYLTM